MQIPFIQGKCKILAWKYNGASSQKNIGQKIRKVTNILYYCKLNNETYKYIDPCLKSILGDNISD